MLRRYDFRCTECDLVEETWCEPDDQFSTCQTCGATSKRIISPIKTHFKGTGWVDADDKWARDHERAAKKQHP